jgi:hypothetical protein
LAREQHQREVIGGNRTPFTFATFDDAVIHEMFEIIDGDAPQHWATEHEGEIDLQILAAAHKLGGPVTLVTGDRTLFHWADGKYVGGETPNVTPLLAPEMLGRLTLCGALPDTFLPVAFQRERGYLDERLASPLDGTTAEMVEVRAGDLSSVQNEVAIRLSEQDRDGGARWIP